MGKRILVSGRVQGVGYRAFVCAWARKLDLKGFVLNLPDGKVEIQVKESTNMDDFLSELRKGPVHSLVEDIEVIILDTIELSSDEFRIEK